MSKSKNVSVIDRLRTAMDRAENEYIKLNFNPSPL